MHQQGKLVNKSARFHKEKRSMVITETYEREITEDEMLKQVERIKNEMRNIDTEVERLSALKDSLQHDKDELLKTIAQQMPGN